MNPCEVLKLGGKYSKKKLAKLLEEPSLPPLMMGQFQCKNSNSTLLFPNLENDKGFNNFFEGDSFHWDSKKTQRISDPAIRDMMTKGGRTLHLFTRINRLIGSVTQPFIYCGRLIYLEHEEGSSKPVHMIFKSIDYDEHTECKNLKGIYSWTPLRQVKQRNRAISPNQSR